MDDNALLIAIALLGLFLIVAVVMIAVQTRRNPATLEEKAAEAAAPPKRAAKRKSGVLIVAGKKFSFDYREKDEESVARLLGLIKNSLQLIKESKYKEVIASRAAEGESLLKKLGGVITFSDDGSMDDILDCFAQYVKTLKS
ncbi:MAG: hypothetical protein LBE89_08230 [Helicobacteraceae bacterium]|jgi:hypothetical protein|nr:hypothetical protein [Helicobacteraceae bacterium]